MIPKRPLKHSQKRPSANTNIDSQVPEKVNSFQQQQSENVSNQSLAKFMNDFNRMKLKINVLMTN